MDYADTYEELTTRLNDPTDVTFSPEQKASSLKRAWKDGYVVKTVWDDSSSFDGSTFDYPVPSSMTTVKEVYGSNGGQVFPEPIDHSMWEVVDGYIQFRRSALGYFDTGNTLYLKGNYKLDYNTDTLDTPELQEYVIFSAAANTIDLLKYMKANLFLKNDTSISELMALGQGFKQDRAELRAMLAREFQSM